MDAAEELAAPAETTEAEPAVEQGAPGGEDQEMLDFGGPESAADNAGAQVTEAPENGVTTTDAAEAAQPTGEAAAMQEDAGKADSAKDSDDVLSQPPHGTEVFMSRIPKEATEAQVRAFCEKAGEVYTIRLPKDPGSPSQNKGFAFCVFKTKEAAEQALEKLQQQHLDDFPGTKVNVVKSEVKNRLFIGNLPRDMSQDAITTALEAEVKGLTSMELMHDKETGASRGFGFAEFYNHAAAEQARHALTRPDFRLSGRELTVTWAEPRRTDQAVENVKALYVNGLPDKDVDEDALKQLFTPYGQVSSVVILHQADDPSKLRGYAFVHFEQRAHLLRVMAEVDAGKVFELGGKQLSLQQARPQVPRDTEDSYGRRGFGGAERGGFAGRGSMSGRGGYVSGGYSGGPRAPPPPMGGRGRGPAFGGRGGRGGYTAPPPSYGYDYDYGYDDYDAGGYEGGYEEYDDGYGGYGGGMMMPMMLPTGQMVYAMAGQAGAGGPARRGGGVMPPHPSAQRTGAPPAAAAGRTGAAPASRGYGRGGGAAAPTGYGAPRSGAPAASAGGPTGYGAPRAGAAAGAAGSGGYVPRGYGQGAGGARTGYGAPRYNPY